MIEQILAIGGAIVLAGNVGAVIFKVIRPSMELRDRVEELERHDKSDHDRLQRLEELSNAQCRMLLAIIGHMIDGNHVEAMKETREQIVELIAKGRG